MSQGDLIAAWACADADWSAANPNHLNYHLWEPSGWMNFVTGRVAKAIREQGIKRVMFHLPFGKPTGQSPYAEEVRRREANTGVAFKDWTDEQKAEVKALGLIQYHMGLDQVDHLRQTGFLHVRDNFYEAMAWLHGEFPEVEVVAYVGSWDGQDEDRDSTGQFDLMWRLWFETVGPLMDLPYVSVVFDALASKGRHHPNAILAEAVRSAKSVQGQFVGCESRFTEMSRWAMDLGYASVAWFKVWARGDGPGVIPYSEYPDYTERIVVIDGHAASLADARGGWWNVLKEVLDAGCTPAINVESGAFAGITAAQIIERFTPKPETGVKLTTIDNTGATRGDPIPDKDALLLWTATPGGVALNDEQWDKLKNDAGLWLVKWLADNA